jgi:phosphatidate cytidylyltransferase
MEDETQIEAYDPATAQPDPPNLALRTVSGLTLALVALSFAWAGARPFGVLVLIAGLLMSWEWGRVVRGREFDVALLVHGTAIAAAAILTSAGFAALGLAGLIIGAIIVLSLEFGVRPITSAVGVLYSGLPTVALLWLRGSEPMGFEAILLIFVIVWASDTLAFAAGRTIGGPKLAPSVSPNKTWSGLGGALVAGGVAAAAFALTVGAPILLLALIGVMLGLVAQVGDLIESAWKRHFGFKDTSQLIPGHGGVMDRLDGVVAVAVTAALFGLFSDPHAPAAALFFRS